MVMKKKYKNKFQLKKIANNWLESGSFGMNDLRNYTFMVNQISKKLFLTCMLLLFISTSFSQDSTHVQIFSLSPISKKVSKVNGLVVGVGFYDSDIIKNQTINGISVDVNPIGLAIPFGLFYLPELIKERKENRRLLDSILSFKENKYRTKIQVNGLNISTGMFFTAVSQNGLNVSLLNRFTDFNGLTINGIGFQANKLNGLTIATYNGVNFINGVSLGFFNETTNLNGLSVAFYNYAVKNKGIQIGIFNISKSKGLQLGIWNINSKRSMPFINW